MSRLPVVPEAKQEDKKVIPCTIAIEPSFNVPLGFKTGGFFSAFTPAVVKDYYDFYYEPSTQTLECRARLLAHKDLTFDVITQINQYVSARMDDRMWAAMPEINMAFSTRSKECVFQFHAIFPKFYGELRDTLLEGIEVMLYDNESAPEKIIAQVDDDPSLPKQAWMPTKEAP